ncbi:fructose PTS transporter subunit IIA [Collinsella sp. zg1085]|uniref:PTS sugar transporter subunit IIA n=1 Tax=Collinsella sp. zg1085 TaxID=2844380 RepID=UPI001C0E886B|nr:fructose PTS transporter subunit IIA [Collinsella sp. zg1085]QWT18013.1 fructose PTS transporter subunit IIA [Collinsella sp. zg1085]
MEQSDIALMSEELIVLDTQVANKDEAICALASTIAQAGRLHKLDAFIHNVQAREAEFSTAIGFGIASPHAKSDSVVHPTLACMRLAKPIDWSGEEVSLIFMIAVPTQDAGERHLQILAGIARRIMHEEFRTRLFTASTAAELMQLMSE